MEKFELKNRSSKLLLFCLEINDKLNKTSKKIYKNLLEDLLSEQSHSFGFKKFDELSTYIIDKIDEIYETTSMSYYIYEFEIMTKKDYKQIYELFYTEEFKKLDKTKELLFLITEVTRRLYKIESDIGKLFSLYLTDERESPGGFSFYPANKLIGYIERKLDLEIYADVNNFEELKDENDYYDPVYGIFYWFFFENEFGKKELEITMFSKNQEEKSIKIKELNDLIEYIIYEENY